MGDNAEDMVNGHNDDGSRGWKTVTYKRPKKKMERKLDSGKVLAIGVIESVVKQCEEIRRRLEAVKALIGEGEELEMKLKGRSEDEDEDEDGVEERGLKNKTCDEKKVEKKKHKKKPKVTVADSALKINSDDLSAYLVHISDSYESQDDIQLMRFADYFGKAFSAVNAAQFPWSKMFRESSISKIADVPLNHISETVYETSTNWINQRSLEALQQFSLWCLDIIFSDFSSQQSRGNTRPTSLKSQVAIFVVLAMVLRSKPDVLINILPTLRENAIYHGQDKLPVITWMIAQASHEDLCVGFYAWTHYLLPTLSGKSNNPQSMDLILQSIERILSSSRACTILINDANRKDDRLFTPADFDLLLRTTFPMPSSRVEATARFEAIYPVLKEIALAGPPGSEAMKQTSQQIFGFAIKAAGEGNCNPVLSKEAIAIVIWCLTFNPECFKQLDEICLDNLEATISILKNLAGECKEFIEMQPSFESLEKNLNSFITKNKEVFDDDDDDNDKEDNHLAVVKEVNKYGKLIIRRLSKGGSCGSCMKGLAFLVIVFGVGVAFNFHVW